MRKLWVAGALALGAVACEPDLPPPSPAEVVVAWFDPAAVPPLIPTPNDLAINPRTGLVELPVDPGAPPAQQEFTRDYLNTLDGFPPSAVATTPIPDLDPSTLSATSVLFLDLKPETGLPPVTPVVDYDAQRGLLTVTPPRSGWPKGGHYAVVVIGGANGVKGHGGKPVVGSPTWALLRFPSPLVECQPGVERTPDTCRATTTLVPATRMDPAERKREQAATALRLEELRLRYAPVLELLESRGIPRTDVALLWTFTVTSLPEATFDPERDVIPFPNDLLLTREPAGTHVNLPVPSGATEEQKQLIAGLNTLDGFSTTMPIVSENSDTRGAIDVGQLEASRLPTATRFLKLSATGAVPQPDVDVCLDCASSRRADGSVPPNPSQLQFVPRLPLEERSTYAVVLTTGLRNGQGQRVVPSSAFALLRSSAPLVDESGRSQVSGVRDTQAQELEKGRLALRPLIDGLVAGGTPRRELVLAWTFTTQSTVSALRRLHALPAAIGAVDDRLPDAPRFLSDYTPAFKDRMARLQLPSDHIGRVFQGQLVVPFVLTGPGGVMRPELRRFDRIPFLLVLPATAAPPAGYPVAVFGHGLTGHHQHVLALANALAGTGRAVIAIDTVKHGERSMCLGSGAVLRVRLADPTATDDTACEDPKTQQCDGEPASPTFGRCIARPGLSRAACAFSDPKADLACAAVGQGRCLDTDPSGDQDRCEGGTFRKNPDGLVTISGWNMLDLGNFFVTRDNFRHQVIDLAQLARVLRGTGIDQQLAEVGAPPLDGTRIDYVGQSLGALLGTLYTAVSPDVRRAVLNAPGGRLSQVLDEATAEDFVAPRTALYSTLAMKQMPQGSPAFDTFVRTAQWILDPADPINYAWHVSNGSDVLTDREALVQFITGDKVIPLSTTRALIDAANARGGRPLSTTAFNPSESELPGDSRHAFLTNGVNPTITRQTQNDMVQFLTQP